MNIRQLIIIVILILSFIPQQSSANNSDISLDGTLSSPEVTIQYGKGLLPVSQKFIKIFPALMQQVASELGVGRIQRRPIVVILNHDDFLKLSGDVLVTAFANSSKQLIVLDYEAMRADGFALSSTMKHEIAHLLIHEAMRGEIPLWLNEGLAQWASGGHSELRNQKHDVSVSMAALSGDIIPLGDLIKQFPANGTGRRLAYRQSLSAVDLIVNEHGRDALHGIINSASGGVHITDAFEKHTGMTMGRFSRHWAKEIKDQANLVHYVQTHLYEILFLFATVALVLGFMRAYYRIKTYKDPEGPDVDTVQDDRND